MENLPSNNDIPLITLVPKEPENSYFQNNVHVIKDACILHNAVIASYKNYHTNKAFFSTIKVYVPVDKLFAVLAISDDLKYDMQRHILTAFRDNILQNIILLYFGIQIANGNITASKIITNNLIQKYFNGDGPPYSKIKRDLISQYKKNHSKYSNP